MRTQHKRQRSIATTAMVAAAMVALASASTFAVAAQTRHDERLQERADTAALAGVNAMISTAGNQIEDRTRVAIAAARAAVSDSRMVVRTNTTLAGTVSVEVTLDDVVKGANVKSVAHYVQPGDAIVPQQSSSLKTTSTANRARL